MVGGRLRTNMSEGHYSRQQEAVLEIDVRGGGYVPKSRWQQRCLEAMVYVNAKPWKKQGKGFTETTRATLEPKLETMKMSTGEVKFIVRKL